MKQFVRGVRHICCDCKTVKTLLGLGNSLLEMLDTFVHFDCVACGCVDFRGVDFGCVDLRCVDLGC